MSLYMSDTIIHIGANGILQHVQQISRVLDCIYKTLSIPFFVFYNTLWRSDWPKAPYDCTMTFASFPKCHQFIRWARWRCFWYIWCFQKVSTWFKGLDYVCRCASALACHAIHPTDFRATTSSISWRSTQPRSGHVLG
jgi:hypothetical protein